MSADLIRSHSRPADARANTLGVVHARLAPGDAGRVQSRVQDSIEQRLASDVTTLSPPRGLKRQTGDASQLPASASTSRLSFARLHLRPRRIWSGARKPPRRADQLQAAYDGLGNEFARIARPAARILVYDVEVKRLAAKALRSASLRETGARVRNHPCRGCAKNLYLGFGAALWCSWLVVDRFDLG